MDDFDIYADLPDFAWLKQEYEADVEVDKLERPSSEKDTIELRTKLLKLERVHKLVLSHYSSLWKTAKQERKRMERQIAELRSQLDNLTFKRNHRQTNGSIVPLLKLSVNAHSTTAFQSPNLYQFNHAPPSMSLMSSEQQDSKNVYNLQPPPIHSILTTNQEWKEKDISDKCFIDNLSSNVITPENSYSSDESDDDIVKKSEYRNTIYGERLRKKLLEEKRNAAKQKQESFLNGKEGTEKKLDNEKLKDSQNIHMNKELNVSKNKEATNVMKETNIKVAKEEIRNWKLNEIDVQNAMVSHTQELKNEKTEVKNMMKNNEHDIKYKNDIAKKKNEEDLMSKKVDMDQERTDGDFKSKKEKDFYIKKQDEPIKLEKQRDLELTREDLSRIRREKDLDRRRKEEEYRKVKREDKFENRKRENEIEKRSDQEIEKNRKEETDRRREEVDRRRKDEEVERRKKEEIDKRRKDEIEKRRKDEIFERQKKEELYRKMREETERRKREDMDRKRKEEEIVRKRKDEIDRRRREIEIERRRREEETERRRKEEDTEKRRRKEEDESREKEDEHHAKKLKEIEKTRNEKQLEELIKERKRIEEEMLKMTDEETEEGEITESFNNIPDEKPSVSNKLHGHKEKLKDFSSDNSKQFQKNQSDKRNNNSYSGRFINSSRITSQTINDNHRIRYHEYVSSKSNRHQIDHISYDKHKRNDLRSRLDQLGHERERRKSSYRNKSQNRSRSNSSRHSDENRVNCSPKRIKLQEKIRDRHDKLKDVEPNKNSKIIRKSPKRRKERQSDERSDEPQHSKKRRKMSPDKDLSRNIKSNKIVLKTNFQARNILDDAKNIINSTSLNESTSIPVTDNLRNVEDNVKEEKEKSTELLGNNQNKILNELTNPEKDQIKDSNENQVKYTSPHADKNDSHHVNKIKTLINELFEVEENSVNTLAISKQVNRFEETLSRTILSDLEDGELTDSDVSMNSFNVPNTAQNQPTDKPIDTINFLEKNNFENGNNESKLATPFQKNNEELAPKSNSEIKDSTLYSILSQSEENIIYRENTNIELHEKISKNEVVVLKDNKPEIFKEIANKINNTSSQIIKEKEISIYKTSSIKCKVNKSNETIDVNVAKQNVLSEVNENRTVSEPCDKINTIIEKENQSSDMKTNSTEVEKTEAKNSTKSISIPTTSNILLEQAPQNCLKINNSENKIDIENRLHMERTELHNGTNTIIKNGCLKENVEVRNNLIKNHTGQPVVDERLHEQLSKSVVKSESSFEDSTAAKSVNILQTKFSLTPVKKVIVIRRRRRPVKLSDSPPVVVINNVK
ncbi:calponin homology domain-containing protein DDB_G0272472-like [Phymastichus coffea]|uniref:calponin homology domain-containing protein DDB_G0272472-like n=1 Tax=Phymastichus coffea TaxID=108790 RepID=UPI00273B74A7|nr:calponin homology domain-containing protein DDB_G0272472-like [Phymastichus coffea]XP_058804732.1 calponin homology domain-containing protein DDB_G0272472-like [Phymastichus coffea]